MKNGKTNPVPHQNPSSTSLSKSKDLKLLQIKPNSPPIQAIKSGKDRLDSKTSTQDRTHKHDSSPAKVKTISHIVSDESLLRDEENPENNISEISIINMLGEGNLISINQDALNFDSVEDSEILRRELEMKNRLIEKLMKENADLREEMESFLTTMEQAKEHQDSNRRITELERHVGQLESENKNLKEQLVKKNEEWVSRENRIHRFEKEIQHYSEYNKSNMEEFYLRLNQQMLSFVDTARRQHDTFLRAVGEQVEDIREEALSNRVPILSKCASLPEKALEHSLNKKTSPKEGFMAQSQTLQTPRNSEQAGKMGKGKILLSSCTKIDENPELKLERRGSLSSAKSHQAISTAKKMDNKENIPVNQKGASRWKDVGMTKSAVVGRGSMGTIGEKKK